MDSEHYFALYFPKELSEQKEKVYNLLLDINSNYSKIVQALLPSLEEMCLKIKEIQENAKNQGKHIGFRDFDIQIKLMLKGSEDEI